MAITISTKVGIISSTAQSFNLEAAAFTAKIKGRTVSTSEVESNHIRLLQIFQTSMQQIAALKAEIQSKTTYANQEEMLSSVLHITGCETTISEGLNQLNDTVLTYFPTAKISYGDIPCIGPKKSPIINTNHPKMLELLSKSSAMREIRGDGNCFVSALITRILENLLEKKKVSEFISFIANDGIQAPELKTEIIETLLYLSEYPSQMEKILSNNHKILPLIHYFRQLAAKEMKEHKDDFEVCFLSDIQEIYNGSIENQSYNQLVDKYVLTMGIDFSHPMIIALCRKLNFPVRIIDPKIGMLDGVNVLDTSKNYGTFCRNDQHYFVIYTPEEPSSISSNSFQPQPSTEIIIHCKIPFGHSLFIRGDGNGLNWQRGTPLVQIDKEAWVFRSSTPLKNMSYKILFNDELWQHGENFTFSQDKSETPSPQFTLPANIDVLQESPAISPCVTVKFPNNGDKLFIRGSGPGMSWEKGIELRYIGNDTWAFEIQGNFDPFEYKLLINDNTQQWETTPNHKMEFGKKEEIVPKF